MPTRPEFLYIFVIRANTGPLKIGITSDVRNRLLALQTSTHSKLHLIERFKFPAGLAQIVERNTHKALASRRLSGEWFDATPHEAMQVVRQTANEAEAQWKPRFIPSQPPPSRRTAEVAKPEVFKVDAPLVTKIPIDLYISRGEEIEREEQRIGWEVNAPKRALVARLAEGKRRKAIERADAAKLQGWLNRQTRPQH